MVNSNFFEIVREILIFFLYIRIFYSQRTIKWEKLQLNDAEKKKLNKNSKNLFNNSQQTQLHSLHIEEHLNEFL